MSAEQRGQVATLSSDGLQVELPILEGSMGNRFIDVRDLSQHGFYTLDPGLKSTAACYSEISYIDSDAGKLFYRGYPIDELSNNYSFTDISYLLFYGELPSQAQSHDHQQVLMNHALVTESAKYVLDAFNISAHPMAILQALLATLAGHHGQTIAMNASEDRERAMQEILAQVPMMAAMAYRRTADLPIFYPKAGLSYTQNFLYMLLGNPTEDYVLNPVFVQALDAIFTLHADHGQNASTSAVRVTASTGANMYTCMLSGIAALWGPAHGGANEACVKMLEMIGNKDNISEYLEKARDKHDPFRLMGFGHRVYKNYDPRAKIIRNLCHEVLKHTERDPLFDLAVELEQVALSDPYFQERNLYPNVDFYSGIILKALDIPTSMFTVIFALARTAGWLAHIEEYYAKHPHPITRPRQCYVGHKERMVNWP